MLKLNTISVQYDQHRVLEQISLQLQPDQIGALLGPSGCGKTTLLRSIAGFETPMTGSIKLADQMVFDADHNQPIANRQIGMVFQDLALFPHLTVADNIGFGLPRSQRKTRVEQLLTLIDLTEKAQKYPHALSGGQQQRVAIARAIAPKPKLLLMDEPFSSLDSQLRTRMAEDVRHILKAEQIMTLMVTHDQNEAFAMADQIGVMQAGHLLQWATAYQLYHEPVNRFVANFIGQGRLIPATVINSHQLETALGKISNPDIPAGLTPGQTYQLLIRPDDIIHNDASSLQAVVKHKTFRGANFLYVLELPETKTELLCFAPSHHNHAIGEAIGIEYEIDHVVMF